MSFDAAEMVEVLGQLVAVESPSADLDATAACAKVAADAGERLLGVAPEIVDVDGRVHVRWHWPGAPSVLLVGHLDTVWPIGTLARWPFTVDGDRASGPGAFDMKGGIVQLLYALASLERRDGVTVLLTTDEEIGSPTSRALIERCATGARAVLVLEPSIGGDGALKTARKGVSMYDVEVRGRAAHAGLEPERGANATVELAHLVLALAGIARPEVGTTVTPTIAASGAAMNVVPDRASLHVDVRAMTVAEQHRVDDELRRLRPTVPGTDVQVHGAPNRPPLEPERSADLFARARRLAADLGMPPLEGRAVGGGSDGNFTAGIGVPTLDGLGAVGDHAHGEGEYVVVSAMPERAALLAELVRELTSA